MHFPFISTHSTCLADVSLVFSDRLDIFLLFSLKIVALIESFNETHGVYGCLCSRAVLYDGDRFSLVGPDSLKEESFLLAPEQRNPDGSSSVDFRADLFGLGVVFYEMLIGRLPDVNELGVPMLDFSDNKLIPSSIVLMINKLCFRVPSDRYHSFFALKDDLARMLQEFQTTGEISHFFPGATDVPTKLVFHDFLYGRDSERGQVQLFLEQVKASSLPSILLVSGYSGVGKTSFVNQVLEESLGDGVIQFQGKFDQDSTRPYSALVSCVLSFVRTLIEDELARGIWKKRLSQALFPNGFVLTHFIPELSALIEDQEELELTDPEKIKNRFNLTFVKFLKVLAQEKTVSLFVDDLQWADSASLQLIGFLLNQVDFKFIFVGAYRSNEYEHNLEFCSFLAHYLPSHAQKGSNNSSSDFSELKHLVFQLSLSGLDLRTLADFLTDLLGHSASDISALASIILQKTHGNPFFIRQFLLNLVESGFLIFEPEARAWMWDLDVLRTLDISDNVVDMVVHRIRALPLATQRVLQVAACLGNSFSLRELALASGIEAFNCELDLWAAVNMGLVASVDRNGMFRFLHDRVQQSAFQLISKEDLAAFRFGVALRLIEGFSEVDLENRLFVVVDNFNFGVLENSDLVLQGIELNYRAGKKAKGLAAFSEALRYFEVGSGLIETLDDSDRFGDRFEFLISFIEVLFICKEFDRAEDLADRLLKHTYSDPLNKVKVHQLLARQFCYLNNYEKSIKHGLAGLSLLGVSISYTPSVFYLIYLIFYELIRFPTATVIDHFSGRICDSSDDILKTALYAEIIPSLYISGNIRLMVVIFIKSFYLTLKKGVTRYSPFILLTYAVYQRFILYNFSRSTKLSRVAKHISDRLKDSENTCKNMYIYDQFFLYWDGSLENTEHSMERVVQEGLQSGDIVYMAYAKADGIIRRRTPLLKDIVNEFNQASTFLSVHEARDTYLNISCYLYYFRALMTDFEGATHTQDTSILDATYARFTSAQSETWACINAFILLKLFLLKGDLASSRYYLKKVHTFINGVLGSSELMDIWMVSFIFYYHSLQKDFSLVSFIHLQKVTFMIRRFAAYNSDKFHHYSLIEKGLTFARKKDYDQAILCLKKAVSFCENHALTEYKTWCLKLISDLYFDKGDHENYECAFDTMVQAYEDWGAASLAKYLRSQGKRTFI